MAAHPLPSALETRCNAVFDAVMWALSRPGLVRDLPEPGMAQLFETLIDRECAVNCAVSELADIAAGCGAALVALEQADHVFAARVTEDLPGRIMHGSDLHPEEGATLVAPAVLETGQGVRLRFRGPGVNGELVTDVGGIPAGFWQTRHRETRYPMGFEILLIDGRRLLGIPRSTIVEVL